MVRVLESNMINITNNNVGISRNENKIIWIEMLRIAACFCVVLQHISAEQFSNIATNTFDWQVDNFYNVIARVAVPVFVMISGSLYLSKSKDISLPKLYKKYILKILILYIFWVVFYGFWDVIIKNKFNISSFWVIIDAIKNSIISPKYHLWYLPTLIGLLIITPILKAIVNGNKSKEMCEYIIVIFFIFKIIKYTLLIFIKSKYITNILNLINLNIIGDWIGYYILGYYLINYRLSKRLYKLLYVFGCLTLLAGIALSGFSSFKIGKATTAYIGPFTIFLAPYAVAIYLFFQNVISKINLSKTLIGIVNKISNCTLGIYLIHPFIREVLNNFKINTFIFKPIISVPLITIVIFIISFIIVHLLKKINSINRWII